MEPEVLDEDREICAYARLYSEPSPGEQRDDRESVLASVLARLRERSAELREYREENERLTTIIEDLAEKHSAELREKRAAIERVEALCIEVEYRPSKLVHINDIRAALGKGRPVK